MKAGPGAPRLGGLSRLAETRLLGGGPESCKRIEHEAVEAIRKADWNGARKCLRLRLKMRSAPTPEERTKIDHILKLIDEAEEKGIGPQP
jgi:hypothetical protein